MRSCLMTLLILLPAPLVRASAPGNDELAERAARAFQLGVENRTKLLLARGHFKDATDAYLELERRGVRTGALYRNLGNAAVLANRWPEAIWAYHAGLKLDPNDRVMRDHLAFARAKVLYPPANQGHPDPESWPAWLHRPTVNELAGALLLTHLLAWLAFTAALVTRRPRYYWLTASLVLVAVLAGYGLWRELEQAQTDLRMPLVILIDNTEFYRGNAVNYPQHPVLPTLPRGLEVRQLHRRGNWLQVRLTSGETGWVHASHALIVQP